MESRQLFTAGLVDSFTAGSSVIPLPAIPTTPLTFNAVATGRDGKIITADDYGSSAKSVVLTRLLSTGAVDTTFGTAGHVTISNLYVSKVVINDDGTILLVGSKMQRLTNYGTADTSFNGGSAVALPFTPNGAAIQSDGKILIAGGINATAAVYRYTTAGSLDFTYGTSGKATIPTLTGTLVVGGIAVDPAGGAMVSVGFTNGPDLIGVVRMTAAGILDTNFGGNGLITTGGIDGNPTPGAIGVTPDDLLIYQVTTYAQGTSASEAVVASYTTDGSEVSDTPLDLLIGQASDLAVLPTDQFVVAGWTSVAATPARKQLVVERFNPLDPTDFSLSPDGSFGTNGATVVSYASPATTTSDQIYDQGNSGWSLSVGPDGKLVIGGTTVEPAHGSTASVSEFTVTRLTADDATIQSLGAISGTIFSDTNGDGTKQSAEPGLAGYGTFLDDNDNGVFDAGDIRVFSDATGHYQFLGLNPTTYTVVQNPPTGTTHSFPSGKNSFSAKVTANAVTTGGGWGIVASGGTIVGTLFDDINGDGIKQSTDPALPGWGSYLDLNHNGVFDGTDVRELADSDGIVTFSGLTAGTYYIQQNTPAGWQRTTPLTLPIAIKLTPGQTATFSIGDKVAVAAKPTGMVKGTLFNDSNADGIRQAAEKGIASRSVYVDLNNDGIFETNEPAGITATNGTFAINGVVSGSVVVRQVLPTGWRQTTPAAGTGVRVTVNQTTPVTGLLFGATTTAAITGTVFSDSNGNGVQNTGEAGLSGIRVYIDTNNNGKQDSGEPNVLTATGGTFTLNDLAPGTYKVRIAVPSGTRQTTPVSNGLLSVTVKSGQVSSGALFGLA